MDDFAFDDSIFGDCTLGDDNFLFYLNFFLWRSPLGDLAERSSKLDNSFDLDLGSSSYLFTHFVDLLRYRLPDPGGFR